VPSSHAWEKVKKNFGKPSLGTPLEQDVVMNESRLKAATQGVSLNECCGVYPNLRSVFHPPDEVDTAACIELQRVQVTRSDQQDE
jgi:hypothetical protein